MRGRWLEPGEVDAGGLFSSHRRAPVVIGDRVARDLKDPGAHRRGVFELVGVAVDAQQDVLQDVFGGVAIRRAARDERQQRFAQLIPCRGCVERLGETRGAHRHPHPASCSAPQQSALASGAQQVSCSAGSQQRSPLQAAFPA